MAVALTRFASTHMAAAHGSSAWQQHLAVALTWSCPLSAGREGGLAPSAPPPRVATRLNPDTPAPPPPLQHAVLRARGAWLRPGPLCPTPTCGYLPWPWGSTQAQGAHGAAGGVGWGGGGGCDMQLSTWGPPHPGGHLAPLLVWQLLKQPVSAAALPAATASPHLLLPPPVCYCLPPPATASPHLLLPPPTCYCLPPPATASPHSPCYCPPPCTAPPHSPCYCLPPPGTALLKAAALIATASPHLLLPPSPTLLLPPCRQRPSSPSSSSRHSRQPLLLPPRPLQPPPQPRARYSPGRRLWTSRCCRLTPHLPPLLRL